MQIARRIALWLLQGYKFVISPCLPVSCRYVPTCSEYAMEAVKRFGILRGSLMTARRILRCHPLGGSGYDPVVREGELISDQNGKRWADEFHHDRCGAN